MEVNLKKRMLLRGGALLALLAAIPKAVLAAAWPREAFAATEPGAALQSLIGSSQLQSSDQIELDAPEIAENGAVVPISVRTSIEGVESIAIVVDKNPRPLAASFEIPPGTMADVSCRIKMGETSDVRAVVHTASGSYSASRLVKVTIGGCGG